MTNNIKKRCRAKLNRAFKRYSTLLEQYNTLFNMDMQFRDPRMFLITYGDFAKRNPTVPISLWNAMMNFEDKEDEYIKSVFKIRNRKQRRLIYINKINELKVEFKQKQKTVTKDDKLEIWQLFVKKYKNKGL